MQRKKIQSIKLLKIITYHSKGVFMPLKHLSLIAVIVLCRLMPVFSDPVFLTEWDWMDGSGFLHEYEVFSCPNQSWDAVNRTSSNEWHLATITSEKEQDALISGLHGVTGEFWLGAYQTGVNGNPADDWAWITGEEWGFKNWAPGEPNDAHGANTEQHLAAWSNWGTSSWLWNDEGHLPNITGYITERTRSVPEPNILSLMAPVTLILFGVSIKRRG